MHWIWCWTVCKRGKHVFPTSEKQPYLKNSTGSFMHADCTTGRFVLDLFTNNVKSHKIMLPYTFCLFEKKSFLTNCKEIFSAKMKIKIAMLQPLQIVHLSLHKSQITIIIPCDYKQAHEIKQRILNLRIHTVVLWLICRHR